MDMQQDVNNFLNKVDNNLRELARRVNRAKEIVDKSAEMGRKAYSEVQKVLDRLQQQRASIRQRSTQKGLTNTLQGKLAAARTRIEADIRKARELDRLFNVNVDSAASSPRLESKPQESQASVVDPSCQPLGASGSSDEDDAAAVVEDVKVFVEQLMESAAEGGLAAEFICKICQIHVVGANPKMTRCSHLFCGDCISKWFAVQPGSQSWAGRAKGAGSVPCPVCKEPLRSDEDLHRVCPGGRSAFLWQMLSATRIVCANNPKCRTDGRCDWQGECGIYQEHIRTCQNVPLGFPVAAQEQTLAQAVTTEVAAPTGKQDENPMAQDNDEGSVARSSSFRGNTEVSEPETSETRVLENFADVAADQVTSSALSAETEPIKQEPSLSSLIAQLVELRSQDPTATCSMSQADSLNAPNADEVPALTGFGADPRPLSTVLGAPAVPVISRRSDLEELPAYQPQSVDLDSLCPPVCPVISQRSDTAPAEPAGQFRTPELGQHFLVKDVVHARAKETAAKKNWKLCADKGAGKGTPPSMAQKGASKERKGAQGNVAGFKQMAAEAPSFHQMAACDAGVVRDQAYQVQAQAQAYQAHAQVHAQAHAAHAHAAQWQAMHQMQAGYAAQWQQAAQARLAYAGRMAQWQAAQMHAAQAAWNSKGHGY